MKKILVCLVGLLMCYLCSCDRYDNTYESKYEKNKISIKSHDRYENYYYNVIEFEYKEHDYIGFRSGSYRLGVVHNPDCKKCGKEVVE